MYMPQYQKASGLRNKKKKKKNKIYKLYISELELECINLS